METMRAAFIRAHGDVSVIEVGELPIPSISASQVLVRVHYSALNHLDIWVRRGWPTLKLTFPHVLGADAAGVVEQAGTGVKHVKKGDEVIVYPGLSCMRCPKCLSGWESLCGEYKIFGEQVDGTLAEYIVAPQENIFLKPPSMTMVESASVGLVYTTAWQMLVPRGQVKSGDWVLVHAAGSGVSSSAIQIAKIFGARVIATAGTEEKVRWAKKLGADHVFNYRLNDFVKEVKKVAPLGVDIIIDHVGRDTWDADMRVVRSGGKIVVCGSSSGPVVQIDLRHVFIRQIQILGSTMGSKADFVGVLKMLSSGQLKAVVDKEFPLSDVRKAHERLENREQFGKVLVNLRE